jgi:6-phosphofructokinase 1
MVPPGGSPQHVIMKQIALLTSGGDAPGMNAAIRAVVRSAISAGWGVVGVRRGYSGLIAGDFIPLGRRDVGGIIDRGGTSLGTSRCAAFLTAEGQQAAVANLVQRDVSGLIVIGGNGSQAGSLALSSRGIRVVGIASTIDNDLPGSDLTLGAMTALDTALQAIDRLRITASAHGRVFLVELMGRSYGYLTLLAGLTGGAEVVLIPEAPLEPEQVAAQIRAAYARGKSHAIVVVAEGARTNAEALAHYFTEHAERLGFELRVCRLGHLQRGGPPGAFDRLNATQLGAAAVEYLKDGRHGVLLGIVQGAIAATPLADLAQRVKPLDLSLLELACTLAE